MGEEESQALRGISDDNPQGSPIPACEFTPTSGSPWCCVASFCINTQPGSKAMVWSATGSEAWPCTQGTPWTWFPWAESSSRIRCAGTERQL